MVTVGFRQISSRFSAFAGFAIEKYTMQNQYNISRMEGKRNSFMFNNMAANSAVNRNIQ